MKRTLFAASALIATALAPTLATAAESLAMTVYKTPWCGCCTEWTNAMIAAGHKVEIKHMEDLTAVKKMAGVPAEMEACHTAMVDGYVIEGHVPLEAIEKLFETKPDIAGLAVPGMPEGSLGMGDDPTVRYDVYALSREPGSTPTVFYEAGAK